MIFNNENRLKLSQKKIYTYIEGSVGFPSSGVEMMKGKRDYWSSVSEILGNLGFRKF